MSWQPNVVVPLAGEAGPRAVTLVCGAVRARDRADVLEFLPDVVHVRRDEQGGAELALTLQQLFAETAHPGGRSAELLARLGDVLLLQIVRHWLQNADENAGWLRALRDPHIHQTLVAIHADPAHPWTVAELAGRAHLSRSRFTERFTELIGRSPLAYVAGWRLDTAADLLAAGHGVAETAHAVGYGSESGFARAFRRHHGHPPSRARKPAD